MPLNRQGTRVHRDIARREDILSCSGSIGCRILAGQGWGHGGLGIGVSVVEAAHLFQVDTEALAEVLLVVKEGHAVAVGLGIADGNE